MTEAANRPAVSKGERLAGFIMTLEAQKEPVAEFDKWLWGEICQWHISGGCDGGRGQTADRGVPGWDGDLKKFVYGAKKCQVPMLSYKESPDACRNTKDGAMMLISIAWKRRGSA